LAEPFRPPNPVVIGLLGGVAAGKTTVADALGDHGLRVIDADQKARELARDPEIRARVADRFGPGVLGPDGGLDRKALAREVFSDEQARRDLEAIFHPELRPAIVAELEGALGQGISVVMDAPLLLESGLIERCDTCIYVDASPGVRRRRARERGWIEGELERRESAQAALAVKKSRCAYIIQTDGPLTDTDQKVTAVLQKIAARHTPLD
jgi:dephospho-CoA kinase